MLRRTGAARSKARSSCWLWWRMGYAAEKERTSAHMASSSKTSGWTSVLFRHETVLLVLVALEWLIFNAVGPRFSTLNNTFDILRHSVEIGDRKSTRLNSS